MAPKKPMNGGLPGPGVDAAGRAVIDPTENVIAILAAAVQRQDDLREEGADHVRELMRIRELYEDKLRDAESKRIDAIRAVDVGAVQRAAEVSAAQAQTLANQVTVSAETLRSQVQQAANAATVALAAALEPIQKDVAELRRSQYELAGQRTSQTETKSDRGQILYILFGTLGALFGAAGIILAVVRA